MVAHWYVIHTKPQQEQRALDNLQQQGYSCFLPLLARQKLVRGALTVVSEPLFARYLFIQLEGGQMGQSWAPIRSTKGVSRLVAFGTEPAKASDALIDALRALNSAPIAAQPLFHKFDTFSPKFRFSRPGPPMNSTTCTDFRPESKNSL